MIINCKNCNTNYLVADQSIGINGRNVKCAKCSTVWFQDPPLNADLSENNIESNFRLSDDVVTNNDNAEFNDKYVPVIIKHKSPILLYISICTILLLIIISTVIFYSDKISSIIPSFKKSKFYLELSDQDLEIQDIEIEAGQDQTSLLYLIVNHSDELKTIDKVTINILDKNNSELKSYTIKDKIQILPHDNYKVNNLLPSLPIKATIMKIKIKGNFFD